MMFLQMDFRSKKLGKSVPLNILLPQSFEGEYKTLWLLHGLTDDHTAWMRYSAIERYADKLGLAVVMPDADRSWYTDSAYGANYFTFISRELPDLLRKHFKGMSEKREDNIVAGLSMGGYGALKLAMSCPEQYGACISLSGALDVTRKGRFCDLKEWQSIFGYDLESPLALEGSEHDVFTLASQNKSQEIPFPKLYMWCGLGDVLIGTNRDFDQHLTSLGVAHKFEESEGDHSWQWWDLHIQDGLRYVLND